MSLKRVVILEIEDNDNHLTDRFIEMLSPKNDDVIYDSSNLNFNKLTIIQNKNIVKKNGRVINLTSKEYEVVLLLAKHAGWVYSREQIYESIWQESSDSCVHAVENMISRIRKKIEDDPSHPQYIITVPGFGYKFMKKLE